MWRALAILTLLTGCSMEGPAEKAEALSLARQAARAGDHAEAARAYRRVTEVDARSVEAWSGLARAELRSGADARESARRLLDLDDSVDAIELLGHALLRAGDAEGAAARLERAYARDPRRHRLCFPLARALERAGRGTPLHYQRCADRGALEAASLLAATRLSLDGLGDDPVPHRVSMTVDRVRPDLDRAQAAARTAAERSAVAALRARVERLLRRAGGYVSLEDVRAQAAALEADAPSCAPTGPRTPSGP